MALYSNQIVLSMARAYMPGGDPGYTFSAGWEGFTAKNSTAMEQSFKVFFSGIHIVVFGYGSEFDWTIDDGPSTHSQPTEHFLFNSTVIEDKNHTLAIGNFTESISVGQSLIRPGPTTPLNSDIDIEVDDIDPSIKYYGNWTATQNLSRHTSANKGDSILFGFCGSEIVVRAEFDKSRNGDLTLAFSVDNNSPVNVQLSSETHDTEIDFYVYNATLIDSAKTGCQHLINVTIVDVSGGQAFTFGSFQYKPSFTVFGDAPSITIPPYQEISSSSSSSSTLDPSSTQSLISQDSNKAKSSIVGPVAGAVAGGIALVAGIIIAILLLRKRRKSKSSSSQMYQYQPNPLIATPFVLPEPHQAENFPGEEHGSPDTNKVSKLFSQAQRRKLAENERHDLQTTSTLQIASPDSTIPPPNADGRPLSTSASDRDPRNRDENGQVSRQMLEMMWALQTRVDALHRPPAYDAPA